MDFCFFGIQHSVFDSAGVDTDILKLQYSKNLILSQGLIE